MTMPDGNTAALDRDQNEIDLHAEAMRLYEVVARDEVLEWLRDTHEGRRLVWDFLADELQDMWFSRRYQEARGQSDACTIGGFSEDATDKAETKAMECSVCRVKIRERAMEMYYEERDE